MSHLKDMLHMLCCNTCCSTCNTCCNMSFKTTCVTCLYSKTSVISLSTLIEETPPSGEVSYFLCSLIKNRVQKDPPRRICTRFFEGGPLTHGSWWGNIENRKPPRGDGFPAINLRDAYSSIWETYTPDIWETYPRHLRDVSDTHTQDMRDIPKTSERCLWDVLGMSLRCLGYVSQILEYVSLRLTHQIDTQHMRGRGLGSSTISKNLMSPTPRRKWYLATGRRAH